MQNVARPDITRGVCRRVYTNSRSPSIIHPSALCLSRKVSSCLHPRVTPSTMPVGYLYIRRGLSLSLSISALRHGFFHRRSRLETAIISLSPLRRRSSIADHKIVTTRPRRFLHSRAHTYAACYTLHIQANVVASTPTFSHKYTQSGHTDAAVRTESHICKYTAICTLKCAHKRNCSSSARRTAKLTAIRDCSTANCVLGSIST